jgi:hypothetical protein
VVPSDESGADDAERHDRKDRLESCRRNRVRSVPGGAQRLIVLETLHRVVAEASEMATSPRQRVSADRRDSCAVDRTDRLSKPAERLAGRFPLRRRGSQATAE